MSSRYRKKRIYTWSPDLAYCVGLLASDGSLSVDRRHIDFTSKDYALAETYRSIMCPHIKIGTKTDGRNGIAYRIQNGDVALYDFLLDIGLTPNKSKTLGPINIPKEYYADLLRGYFDGDGTSYAFWDKRWRSSYVYNMTFISASEKFLRWIQVQNSELIPISAGGFIKYSDTTRVFRLTYGKADTMKLFNYMYYRNDLPHLARKKQRLMSYFTQGGAL